MANKGEKAVFQLSRDIGNSKEPSAIVQNINSLPGVALSLRFGKALLKDHRDEARGRKVHAGAAACGMWPAPQTMVQKAQNKKHLEAAECKSSKQ